MACGEWSGLRVPAEAPQSVYLAERTEDAWESEGTTPRGCYGGCASVAMRCDGSDDSDL